MARQEERGHGSLRAESRSSTSGTGSRRIRAALTVAEVALSVALLIGAGLLIRSFARLQQVNPGFNTSGVMTARVGLPNTAYPGGPPKRAFFERLLTELRGLPGIEAAAIASGPPLSGDFTAGDVKLPTQSNEEAGSSAFRFVGPGYFAAMGIPLRGREFTSQDVSEAPPVAIISAALAAQYFPNQDPIGRTLIMRSFSEEPHTIVGVAGDVKTLGLEADAGFMFYGAVTLNKTAGSFTGSGGFTGTQANLVNGVATFSGFTSTAPGSALMVQASSPGYVSTPLNEGGPFNITSSGANCAGLDPCLVDSNFGNSPVNAAATGGAFTFLGLNASSVPASVLAPGGGCQYFVSVGAGAFEAVDNRTAAGELRFTYNVPTKLIQKSPNNGQPFIPLCAGAKRLVNNQPVDCNPSAQPGDADGPWLGRGLNPDGTFDGSLRYAVCGEGGYWWAVMGSFQQPIDPSLNPTITGWGGITIGNVSYRQLFLRVPTGWDWRVGG